MDYYIYIQRSLREAAPADLQTNEWRYQPGEVITMVPVTYFAGTPVEGQEYPFSEAERLDPHTKLIVSDIKDNDTLALMQSMLVYESINRNGNHPPHYYRKRLFQFNQAAMPPPLENAIFLSSHDTLDRVVEGNLTAGVVQARPTTNRVQNP